MNHRDELEALRAHNAQRLAAEAEARERHEHNKKRELAYGIWSRFSEFWVSQSQQDLPSLIVDRIGAAILATQEAKDEALLIRAANHCCQEWFTPAFIAAGKLVLMVDAMDFRGAENYVQELIDARSLNDVLEGVEAIGTCVWNDAEPEVFWPKPKPKQERQAAPPHQTLAITLPSGAAPRNVRQAKFKKAGRKPKEEKDTEAIVLANLRQWHQYDTNDDSTGIVRNPEPASAASLAKGSSPASVTRALKKIFDSNNGYKAYKAACISGRLAGILALKSGDLPAGFAEYREGRHTDD